MITKILLTLISIVFYEIIKLINDGAFDNPIAFGFLKTLILITIILSIILVNTFNLGLIKKIREVIPPILETAAKVLKTPIKSAKKWMISKRDKKCSIRQKNNIENKLNKN